MRALCSKPPALVFVAAISLCAASAAAQSIKEDNTRGVRILDAPDAPSGQAEPAPRPSTTAGRAVALGAIPIDPKVGNTADVALDLLPGLEVAVGSKVSFRVTAKKPGYLVLVDVDASGKLTQIYPAPNLLVSGRSMRPSANYVKPGSPLFIPAVREDDAGVEYVAAPPAGTAMIVAILSDQPVQILDLPDIPASLVGQAEALAYLTTFAKELRIPRAGRGGLQEARWSFDAKFYAIR